MYPLCVPIYTVNNITLSCLIRISMCEVGGDSSHEQSGGGGDSSHDPVFLIWGWGGDSSHDPIYVQFGLVLN